MLLKQKKRRREREGAEFQLGRSARREPWREFSPARAKVLKGMKRLLRRPTKRRRRTMEKWSFDRKKRRREEMCANSTTANKRMENSKGSKKR